MSSIDDASRVQAAPKKAQRDFRPVRSSGPMASSSGSSGSGSSGSKSKKKSKEKRVYTYKDLMSYKEANQQRPEGLPEMTITTSSVGVGGASSGGSGPALWDRGKVVQPRPSSNSRQRGPSNDNWKRAPPNPPNNDPYRNSNPYGQGGGRPYDEPPMRHPDSLGPVVNNTNLKVWKKPKVGSLKEQVRKKVFGILNKMTKDRFAKLSEELCAQPIETMEILRTVILLVFDKALMEPAFGDMYSDLCLKLQQKLPTSNFVRTVKDYDSDQYYWTADNDINEEVAGPYERFEEVRDAARTNVDSVKVSARPKGVELQIEDYLVEKKNSVKIFIGSDNKYYAVAKRVPADSQEVGLFGPFPDKTSAEEKAKKNMSFKRMLLNQCQVEYEKEYEVSKFDELIAAHKQKKDSMDSKQYEMELEDLEFDRLKVKRRCLGNISFIGQLYVKRMLQEKIMHECICNLSGIEFDGKPVKEGAPASYKIVKRPDEEDIESLCKLMATIGKFFDHKKNASHEQKLEAYMKRMGELKNDMSYNSRYRFMAMDTLDLRKRNWIPRIKEEKMKTLDEVRGDHMKDMGKGFNMPRGGPPANRMPKGKGGYGVDPYRQPPRGGMPFQGGKGSGGYQPAGRQGDMRGPKGGYPGYGDRRDPGKGSGRGMGYGGERMGGSRFGGDRPMGGGGATPFTSNTFTGGTKGKGKGRPQMGGHDGRGDGKGGSFRPGGRFERPGGDSGGRPTREPTPRQPVQSRPTEAPAAAAAVKFDKDGQKKIIKTFIDDNMFRDCMQAVSGRSVEDLTAFGELALFSAVDMKDRERRKVFEMLDQLLLECRDFTPAVIMPGLGKMITDIPDLIVDIPLVCDYLGGFIGKRLVSGNINMEWLLAKCGEKNDPEFGISVIDASIGGKLIAAIVKTLTKEDVSKFLSKDAISKFLGSTSFEQFLSKNSELSDKF